MTTATGTIGDIVDAVPIPMWRSILTYVGTMVCGGLVTVAGISYATGTNPTPATHVQPKTDPVLMEYRLSVAELAIVKFNESIAALNRELALIRESQVRVETKLGTLAERK